MFFETGDGTIIKPEKQYRDMTDDELREALVRWESNVVDAPGWSSAYFSAKQVQAIVAIGNERGLGLTNKYPIKIG